MERETQHQTLPQQVATVLSEHQLSLATAESCTGGGIASAITDLAGSSAYFDCGFVTYSNEAKQAMLGVPSSTLEAFGAVSEETALAMVTGALEHSQATIAVSVTGIAGPTGAVPGKPVGTVCFGLQRQGEAPISTTQHFAGDRSAVRLQSVEFALGWVLQSLGDSD